MSTIHVSEHVNAEQVERALTTELPAGYAAQTSGTTVKVKRGGPMWSTVHVKPEGAGTKLCVTSGGLIVGRAVNAFTVTPKVRHALQHAFPAHSAAH